jgi:starvation-inducible DNA-binding protein
MTTSTQTLNIGLDLQARKAIADGLSHLLADTYTLALKTQFCHWNVTGPHFIGLHTLFGEQYEEMSSAVDRIAERIRAVGHPAPGSFKAFLGLTHLDEYKEPVNWQSMLKQLMQDHETLSRTAKSITTVVDHAEDEATLNLLADRMEAHEAAAWFLRSHLES